MSVMRVGHAFVIWFGVAVGSGCVHTAFTPTTSLRFPPRPANCHLDVILDGAPPFSYVVIGRVSTESTAPGLWALGENNEVAMERLREAACSVGAHGLLQVGTQSQGNWSRDTYSKSTTGGAVAFVYVDESGRPLPPPTAQRVVIQPGAYPVLASPPPGAPGLAPASPPPAAQRE